MHCNHYKYGLDVDVTHQVIHTSQNDKNII